MSAKCLALVVLGLSSFLRAGDPGRVPLQWQEPEILWGEPNDGLRMGVALTKHVFAWGEPIVVGVRVQNLSDKPRDLPSSREGSWNISVTFSDDKAPVRSILDRAVPSGYAQPWRGDLRGGRHTDRSRRHMVRGGAGQPVFRYAPGHLHYQPQLSARPHAPSSPGGSGGQIRPLAGPSPQTDAAALRNTALTLARRIGFTNTVEALEHSAEQRADLVHLIRYGIIEWPWVSAHRRQTPADAWRPFARTRGRSLCLLENLLHLGWSACPSPKNGGRIRFNGQ